ncbi:D-alanyl-D-alanine carboxypeptidase/D-alanyl-D-alanine endopeptidase [Oceanibium sediminis]|uniref:D-alanyl-D-alanine carboxypeptidase/D-alanyl-D-alanine endopeptidase n=1 Tax=Oceanibium sediminis TaxID=2026339 RepID=UPI000DD40F01|nr:D-alanyl-D-alanine carboxypeptidase/D-alanyl-D-alanine-endopeptidase [Oceanibium sediminis]
MSLTRRNLLAGIAASLPLAAEARIAAAPRPRLRPTGLRAPGTPPGPEQILSESGLSQVTGFALRDLETGRAVEQYRPDAALPPASVTKAVTALYALSALGPEYVFRTAVAISGPVVDGRVQGDLYLIGGGDPQLDTDGLASLAEQTRAAGITGVNGRAYVVASALPYAPSIDPSQPSYVGYNPAISGLNLNFNRVHFEWKPNGGDFSTRLSARTAHHDPVVQSVEMRIEDRGAPVFDYASADGRDLWSVSRRALGKGGARWLPVRAPRNYAAEVFRTVAEGHSLRLPPFESIAVAPRGLTPVASTESAALKPMLRAMLKYSTNLTAEVAGLRASQALALPADSLAASARSMTDWLRRDYALSRATFVNHSGLSDQTRICADEMVQVLDIAASGPLPELMKAYPLRDKARRETAWDECIVSAKTGTLNFTRGLSGYLTGINGKRFAFAIFSADLDARARAGAAETPRGARSWMGRARVQELELLRRWASLYGAA